MVERETCTVSWRARPCRNLKAPSTEWRPFREQRPAGRRYVSSAGPGNPLPLDDLCLQRSCTPFRGRAWVRILPEHQNSQAPQAAQGSSTPCLFFAVDQRIIIRIPHTQYLTNMTGRQKHMTPWMKPVNDASEWTGDDLERDQSWKFSRPRSNRPTWTRPCNASRIVDWRTPRYGPKTSPCPP